jgi:hypothetical protein
LRLLEVLAKLCAIAAGVLLTVVTLMTCVSLLGRNLIGTSIVGDFAIRLKRSRLPSPRGSVASQLSPRAVGS